MINLHIKFELSVSTNYKDMEGNAKRKNWDGLGGYGSPKVTGKNVTI